MSSGFENGSPAAEQLSALADGEVDGAAAAAACGAWKTDAELRRTWHSWHLIGDVLRSEDLASSAGRDQRFLLALRERMADEPVVLAPEPLPGSAAPGRRAGGRWLLPSAVAAGFMLVVGTVVVLDPAGTRSPDPAASTLARVTPPAAVEAPIVQASVRDPAMPVQAVAVNGRMIRDPRLERYLAAHKQFAGTSALGVPSTFLRSATVDAEPR